MKKKNGIHFRAVLPPEIHRKLKRAAALSGLTMGEIAIRAIEQKANDIIRRRTPNANQ